ncbi:MAG: hypothetical protein HS108_05625 [Planctomycetes bacterium]|jgi:hypothetical protein|nr:hypothetical protein [Planctomycetota bacterium]MCL4729083.1 hypothetical protein [Planctomycetota bacterium]
MLATILGASVTFVIGAVCAYLALGMPFAWVCRRMARDDALTPIEAWLAGLLAGPFGILIVRYANRMAAEKAEIAAGELEVKLIQAQEEKAAEQAAVTEAPIEAFQVPPRLADNIPLPPEDLPGAQAFRPPPPETQGAWLTDPSPTSPQPTQAPPSDTEPPRPVTSDAG